jgi:ABC-type proline/glycine betaine transport system ATPase subunit
MSETESKELKQKIEAGVKASIAVALAEHKRLGHSIAIWRDGAVVTVAPEEIQTHPSEQSNGLK